MSFSLNAPQKSLESLPPGVKLAVTEFYKAGAHYVLLNKDSKIPIWKA